MALDVQSSLSHCPVKFDARPVRFRVGLVVLATDHSTERDFSRLLDPDQVGVYVTRIAFENPANADNLRRTGPRLTEAAALVLPDEKLDAIIYACTAASVVLGNEMVAACLNAAKPDTPCITPSSAAFDAFSALGVGRVSILTPYTVDVTDELVRYFSANGPDVVSATCLGIGDDREMARITQDCIVEAGLAAMDPQAEALFISCTALRSAQCASRIEEKIGKPVITSNQAMAWRTIRHLGLRPRIADKSRIFNH